MKNIIQWYDGELDINCEECPNCVKDINTVPTCTDSDCKKFLKSRLFFLENLIDGVNVNDLKNLIYLYKKNRLFKLPVSPGSPIFYIVLDGGKYYIVERPFKVEYISEFGNIVFENKKDAEKRLEILNHGKNHN